MNIFSESYSNKIFVIGELNWKDVINNPINELSEDDENYVFLYHSSYTDDDNKDYDENVDMDPLFEKQMNYYMSTGMIFHNTTSDDSNESEKCKASSATSEKKSLSKKTINLIKNIFPDFLINFCILCFNADSDNEDFGFGIDEENDGDELMRFTQDKTAKKHDYIPSRTKKIRTESIVARRPSSKKKTCK